MSEDPKVKARTVDDALSEWRQGDCVLGQHWFVHRFDPKNPLTAESRSVVGDGLSEGTDLAESETRGLMIANQSCDIVRSCSERPFVEACPLVEVDERLLREIDRGRRPQYVFVPGIAALRLAADLDRVMTVEKAVVARWERTPGCDSDGARRRLALALARKRVRFAFPDDFVRIARKLQDRLQEKHDRASNEGRALRALREIRARAAPSWDTNPIEITLWFIRETGIENETFEGKGWDVWCDAWVKLVTPSGRFQSVEGVVVTLDDISAQDYLESDPLDLDHLSARDG